MPKRDLDLIIIVGLLLIRAIIACISPFVVKSSLISLSTIFLLILGVIYFVAAYGLWNFKRWGFITAVVILALDIPIAVLRGNFVGILILAIILVWLFRSKEKFKD